MAVLTAVHTVALEHYGQLAPARRSRRPRGARLLRGLGLAAGDGLTDCDTPGLVNDMSDQAHKFWIMDLVSVV